MKLESYNVENLFMRAVAMDGNSIAYAKDALTWHAEVNFLLAKPHYTEADKAHIVALLKKLGIDRKDDAGKFAILRQNHGQLLQRPRSGPVKVVAGGRNDWIGWVDLKLEEVDETATRNTARVIKDSAPDVLAVIEAESRPALIEFSDHVLPAVGGQPFGHVMLIDGNDPRGIDVGIMTRPGYEIIRMASHVDDVDGQGRIFSRDCAEYEIRTARGNTLVLLVNHLKSKGFGEAAANDAKRERQALRIKAIYQGLIDAGHEYVAVAGDFNDAPGSKPLVPLLSGTNLKDITDHPKFIPDGRPGTYLNGTASQKIDYILLSPALFASVKAGGIFRKGVWAGKNGTIFSHYPEITKPSEAASDHAAIWAECDI
ncbi:MAG: endonuclease/exonuclease/phosphatase family protein [Deltaproteobacteria bacterium]